MGRIVRLTDFGAFVEIEEGIEGLVHVSELSDERVEQPKDRFTVEQVVRAKVIKMDQAERKIGLSIKAASVDPLDSLGNLSSRDSGTTIGDIVGKIDRNDDDDDDESEE